MSTISADLTAYFRNEYEDDCVARIARGEILIARVEKYEAVFDMAKRLAGWLADEIEILDHKTFRDQLNRLIMEAEKPDPRIVVPGDCLPHCPGCTDPRSEGTHCENTIEHGKGAV